MPMGLGAAAGISAAGNIIGGGISASSAKDINQANQDFAREMSNTRYQRGTADMKAAGLNPILAATGGSSAAASSPTGQMTQNPGAHLAQGISNATSAYNATRSTTAKNEVANATVDNMKEQNKLIQAQQAESISRTAVNAATAKMVAAKSQKQQFIGKFWEQGNNVLQPVMKYINPLIKGLSPGNVSEPNSSKTTKKNIDDNSRHQVQDEQSKWFEAGMNGDRPPHLWDSDKKWNPYNYGKSLRSKK